MKKIISISLLCLVVFLHTSAQITPGLQLPYGIQPVNAVPVDAYYGPFTSTSQAISAIPQALRYDGLTVQITGSGNYWWLAADLSNTGLIAKTSGGGASLSGGAFGNIGFLKNSTTLRFNAYLTWDTTNLRFGVGVTTPANFITFTGIQPVSISTSPGTSAQTIGGINLTSAQGGNTTITTTGVGGPGGDINIITGQGGTAASAATSSTAGGSGNVLIESNTGTTVTRSSTTVNGGSSGNVSLTASNAGGASEGTTNNGGQGGNVTITTGGGGAAGAIISGGTNANGGNAGNFSTIGGAGGNATHASSVSIGGNGSTISFTSGVGGNAANASSNEGGNGGNVNFTAGKGGTGSSVNGTNGQITFTADATTSIYIGNGTNGSVGIGNSTPTYLLDVKGGEIGLNTAGKTLRINTASNGCMGTGTLSGGTVTISTTCTGSTSAGIFLTDTESGSVTNLGNLAVTAVSSGASFTVTSTNGSDASTFNWIIFKAY